MNNTGESGKNTSRNRRRRKRQGRLKTEPKMISTVIPDGYVVAQEAPQTHWHIVKSIDTMTPQPIKLTRGRRLQTLCKESVTVRDKAFKLVPGVPTCPTCWERRSEAQNVSVYGMPSRALQHIVAQVRKATILMKNYWESHERKQRLDHYCNGSTC